MVLHCMDHLLGTSVQGLKMDVLALTLNAKTSCLLWTSSDVPWMVGCSELGQMQTLPSAGPY